MRGKPMDKERLEHILEAANNIQEFASGVSYVIIIYPYFTSASFSVCKTSPGVVPNP